MIVSDSEIFIILGFSRIDVEFHCSECWLAFLETRNYFGRVFGRNKLFNASDFSKTVISFDNWLTMSQQNKGSGGSRGERSNPNPQRELPKVGPDGNEINPFIPKFISSTPWYVEQSDDYLHHQRSTKETFEPEWYDRGKKKEDDDSKASQKPVKFRKGACKNCGAMTHGHKDCMERPRKVGAKYSGVDIQPDEDLKNIRTTWESKRDRWNGYDAGEYQKVVQNFETVEKQRAQEAEEERLRQIREGNTPTTGASLAGAEKEEDAKLTTRTLRTREDKASYLTDLREDAAVFNPKSRTLRTDEDGKLNERGLFERKLTDLAEDHNELRELAELAAEQGQEINLESNPTEAILKLREIQKKKREAAEQHKKSLLSKYGGEEYLKRSHEELEGPTDGYTEYTKDGQIKKPKSSAKEETLPAPKEGTILKSKYEEDIYPGNHTSVWGSYWKEGQWGFGCCHSLVKQSYCLGAKGKEINDKPASSTFTGVDAGGRDRS